MFDNLLKDFFDLKRRTNEVFALQTVTAILTAERNPNQPSAVMMTLAGSALGTVGYITIKGTDPNGASQSEQLSFSSGSGFAQTVKRFLTLTGATVSGLTGGKVKGEAFTPAGEPAYFDATILSSIPGRLEENRKPLVYSVRGEVKSVSHKLYVGSDVLILDGDIIVCNGNSYKAEYSNQVAGYSEIHHQEIALNLYVH